MARKENKLHKSRTLYIHLPLTKIFRCTYNIRVRYQWDPAKAQENIKKHKIDFADVVGVFEDEMAITIEDPDVEGEQRFVTLGLDKLGRLVVVVFAYRRDEIRLISARKANKGEERQYARRI